MNQTVSNPCEAVVRKIGNRLKKSKRISFILLAAQYGEGDGGAAQFSTRVSVLGDEQLCSAISAIAAWRRGGVVACHVDSDVRNEIDLATQDLREWRREGGESRRWMLCVFADETWLNPAVFMSGERTESDLTHLKLDFVRELAVQWSNSNHKGQLVWQ